MKTTYKIARTSRKFFKGQHCYIVVNNTTGQSRLILSDWELRNFLTSITK